MAISGSDNLGNPGVNLEIPDLTRHYEIFKAVIFSKRFTGFKARLIQDKLKLLRVYLYGHYEQHRFERICNLNETKSFALEELYFHYVDRKHYKKYDGLHSISTWIVHYIYHNINNLVRRYRPRTSGEGVDTNFDLLDGRNKNFVLYASEYEDWLELPNEYTNPENILVAKQLLEMMYSYFGKRDLDVIIGKATMLDVIKRYRFNYDQYWVSLNRRKEKFRSVLMAKGYGTD